MKVVDIETWVLTFPLSESFYMSIFPIQRLHELVVKVHTDEGITGIGQSHGLAEIVEQDLKRLVIGEDPLRVEHIWEKMFQTTYRRGLARRGPTRQQILASMAAIDIALWDIKGKVANEPLWRLLGGFRTQVPAYASDGYYRKGGIAVLREEMAHYVHDLGYKAVKMKVGGVPLERDVERVRVVREAVGEDVDIMLDCNQAYDIDGAIEAARHYAPFNIRWYEEPVRWYDSVEGLRQVAAAVPFPVASGEGEHTLQGCRDLISRGGIRIMQFDSTVSGGITLWLKVAALGEAQGVTMAPHHDAWIHVHTVAAVPNGLILECFPNPERDPVWVELFTNPPQVKNGFMVVPEGPGLGLELNEETLRRRGQRL